MNRDITKYKFIQKLKDLSFVDGIYLYGSRARGDNMSRSDIDLAILCPTATNRDWSNVIEIIEEADTLLEIDCARLDTVSDKRFLSNIERDKVVIYEL